jgi:hypothetical protein
MIVKEDGFNREDAVTVLTSAKEVEGLCRNCKAKRRAAEIM